MTGKDLLALSRVVEGKGQQLTALSAKHHATGDLAARVARTAPDRRTERHALNVNRTTRAVGEAVSASLWLLRVMGQSFEARDVRPEHGLPALDRMLAVALELADDLAFEAHVATSYMPQQPMKRRRLGDGGVRPARKNP